MRTPIVCGLALLVAAPVSAQSVTWRARAIAEVTSVRANDRAPLRQASDPWTLERTLVASADGTWTLADRASGSVALAGLASDPGAGALKVREAYIRVAAATWLDVEAGTRLVRWGVGYGFAPAGVLDPARVAHDPTDRLQLNEGRLMVRADAFRGDSSVTLAVAERRSAVRVGTLLNGGVEIGLIASASRAAAPQFAATVTHVIGDHLEWHAEALVHSHEGRRTASAAIGAQYTFETGLNVVVEYHRNGRGLDDEDWQDVLSGRRSPGSRPARQHTLFFRAAAADADARLAPELIAIANLDDGGWTIVPALGWRFGDRVTIHARALRLTGDSRALAGTAPFTTQITSGVTVRF